MNFRDLASSVGPRGRLVALLAVTALAVSFASSVAQAQAPKAKAPAAAPKAPAPAAQAPATPPAGGQPQAQAQQEMPQLIYAPWTKFCLKGQDANAKQVCFIGKDGRIESGQPVVAAVIIEPEGEPKKILRVTLPLGMQLQPGTRIVIDNNQFMEGKYVICFQNGCMSDYEATPEFVNNLKKGQTLFVQAINSNGTALTLPLPLQEGNSSFAKAYDGPPTDPKQFEETQKKLQEELQKRAEEQRKKLEQTQPGQPQAKQ
ncbi:MULTISPECIES: invasion associated locus B family protein [unclassified Bradyrhizobium]|uniref:invasion associated locus B family protein n=1 Tax=unclassified Bradyrhizobium TaxID=2631580 RepID=UPI0028E85CCC|nr:MULTISPECIES: invasion associated locus B family protein [unclassified Bradyrhizobium]